tara:strand:+ start:943 stop:1260 length:318 start_codon:yes stop_codon:yes gene_type:complete
MTPFTKQNLTRQGNLIIFQQGENTDRKIVARFKYQKGSIATFMTHLRKNWTAEDYFAKESTGLAPLQIVEETGYIQPHIKKELKRKGYDLTPQGFKQMIRDQLSR